MTKFKNPKKVLLFLDIDLEIMKWKVGGGGGEGGYGRER